ncbi:MAG: B12-binding domain-containing radical SAM protein [Candidatus Nanoarchaeia archaeon]
MEKVRNVALMYPNLNWTEGMQRTKWITHPYNLSLIASMIKNNYETRIIDANLENMSEQEFAKCLQKQKVDVLGISTTTNEYSNCAFTSAKIAKETNPNIKVIAGGVSVITDPEPFINNKNIDGIVVGEGEYAFLNLLGYYNKKNELPKGVWIKENGNKIGEGRVEFIQDLDSLPLPSYELVDFLKYANSVQRESVETPRIMPYARILTSRGCPHNCCFCEVASISGKKVRFRSLESITSEIEWLINDYGIKYITYDDDNLTVDRLRAKKLFKTMIDRKYNLKWGDSAVAIGTFDEEMVSLMKESGCEFLGAAIESGNERVLKDIIHKPLNLKKAKEAIKLIKKYEIDFSVNFILGFPGEKWSDIRETIKFAEEIDPDYVKFFIATPLPRTELYEVAKKGNYLKEGFGFDKHLWTEGSIDTEEFRHQDLKILRAYEWDRINFSSQAKKEKIARMMGVSLERLDEIRKNTLKIANP